MKRIREYLAEAILHPKKLVWAMDRMLIGGRMKKRHFEKQEKKRLELERWGEEHPEEYFDMQIKGVLQSKPVIGYQTIAVRDIVLAQQEEGKYAFYDIAVRLLAIDQYYGKNDYGFDLYARMQENSGNGTFWKERFIKLIQSYEKNGLDPDAYIDLDENLKLLDGAHRLALALYQGVEFLNVKIHQASIERRWTYNFFLEMKFSLEEMDIIQKATISLFNKCNYQFVGVIWPSAYQLRDEVVKTINKGYEMRRYPLKEATDYKVATFDDRNFSRAEFIDFFRAMYYADDMDEEGIQRKIRNIANCLPEGCDEYPVRIFYLDVLNPEIVRNKGNQSARFQQIARLKVVIRNRFKDRILHYEYDNIMHISDNYQQSKLCDYAIHYDKDMQTLFTKLSKQHSYVIINK